MSLSQRFQVDDKGVNGSQLSTSIQSLTLTLDPHDFNVTFSSKDGDFASTLQRTIESIKNYFLGNINSFVQGEKDSIQSVLQILTQFFTVIKIPYLNNNTLTFRPMNKTERLSGDNPMINSNYISTLVHVEVETP